MICINQMSRRDKIFIEQLVTKHFKSHRDEILVSPKDDTQIRKEPKRCFHRYLNPEGRKYFLGNRKKRESPRQEFNLHLHA